MVSPHPIGLPEIIRYDFFNNERITSENKLDKNLSIRIQQYEKIPEGATHYVIGEVTKELQGNKIWKQGNNQTGFDFAIQFYRI